MKHRFNLTEIVFTIVVALVFGFCGFAVPAVVNAASKAKVSTAAKAMIPTVVDPGYRIQPLMPKSHANGFNGLAFDSRGQLYAGSVQGSTLYKIDKDTGTVSVFIPPPDGGADDLVFEPNGKVYWTAFFLGKVFARGVDGKVVTLAENLPGVNAITRSKDGRVFFSQCFLGDALWELDLSGKKQNRKIAEKLGILNAFTVHTDGYLYGPLWGKGQVVKVDVNTGNVQVVADGFKVPCAVKFDSKGNLFALDNRTGEVVQVDIKTGAKKTVAVVRPHVDNFAIDAQDRMFVSTNGDSSIFEVDVKTGKVRTVVPGLLACPQGIAVWNSPEGEILLVADNFAYKRVDGFTGESKESPKVGFFPNTVGINGDKVMMAGWFFNKIEVFDAKNDDLLYTIPGFKAPFGMLMLPDESILVAEAGTGSILRVRDKEGKQRDVVAKDLAHPVYLAPAGPDAVYVTEFLAGRVTKVDLKTGEKKVVASGLKAPKGIAVKPDGTILVVNVGTKEVLQINPATGAKKTFVKNLAVGINVPEGFLPSFSQTGIAIAESGNIYVTSDIDNVIYKISPK